MNPSNNNNNNHFRPLRTVTRSCQTAFQRVKTMRISCSNGRVQLLALIAGAISIVAILTVLFFYEYPTVARKRVIDAVVFANNTDAIERFRTTKDLKNLRLSFYLYNVTNAEDVIKSSSKIKLEEIGPFVYSEYKEKEFISHDPSAGSITFKLKIRYTLDRQLSKADPADVRITWPNVPLLAAKGVIDKLSYGFAWIAKKELNYEISRFKEPAFITDTVQNFLFDGSKRDFFEKIEKKFAHFIPSGSKWPLKDNKFGLLYDKNFTWDPTRDRTLTASTGLTDYTTLNQYTKVNGSTKLPFWKPQPSTCNKVAGSDGEFFAPFVDRSKKLEVYSVDLCRKIALTYRHEANIRGVYTYKYTIDHQALQSGQNNPDNACYCLSSGNNSSECQLDGLIDLSTCNNPNVVASGAHFLLGSPELVTRVDGITPPIPSQHEPTVYLEPKTGIVAKVNVPIQFNIRLEKDGFNIFDFFKEEKPLIIPLLWVDESAELSDDQASLLKRQLLLLNSWLVISVLGAAIFFILAIVVVFTVLCLRFRDSRAGHHGPRETDPLISQSQRAT